MKMSCSCEKRLKDVQGEVVLAFFFNGNACIVKTTLDEYSDLKKEVENDLNKMKERIPVDRVLEMQKACARSAMRELPLLGTLSSSQSRKAVYHITFLLKLGALPQDLNNGIHLSECELNNEPQKEFKIFKSGSKIFVL